MTPINLQLTWNLVVETECFCPKIKNKTRRSNLALVDSSSNETKTEKKGKGKGEERRGKKGENRRPC